MCSWCYAFKSVWEQLKTRLPENVDYQLVLGGLAPDNHEPMSTAMREQVQLSWHNIEKKCPHIRFNFDFWTQTTPIRSTYPSCRAVLSARMQSADLEQSLLREIQQAYYQQAQNPALDETLFACAETVGLDSVRFQQDYASAEIEQQLQAELSQTRLLNASVFPSLYLQIEKSIWPVAVDYQSASIILEEIEVLLSFA